MPTLRLIYLTEQQYADMTDHAANNTTTAAAAELPTTIHDEQSRLDPIDADDDATRNVSSNSKKPPADGGVKMEHQEESDDHEDDDDDYVDTLLQEAIDAVNQQVVPGHEEMALSSHEESENDNDSSTSSVHLDTVQEQFQDETVSSDEEIENCSSCTSSVNLDAIQQTSGNKRKRRAPQQSFDDRLNDLMAFKAKYGHCYVSQLGENASLGQWCSQLRWSYKKIQSNQKPRTKLSDAQIQRLSDAGFKWSLGLAFDERFNDLMAFKAKFDHCDVSCNGEDASLGKWCSHLRSSYKKMQNNQKPNNKLSDEQIQRLNDAGFKWSLKVGSSFDKRFNDLMTFKPKYGHCDVSKLGENASLGQWCGQLRSLYQKMQNNQTPPIKLSDGQIQHLNDAGFKWSLQRKANSGFDERFNDIMSFKAKYGHCDVSQHGEDPSLGQWCSELRRSYKKIQNYQKPKRKLSDEQIQHLNDAGFNWSLQGKFHVHFNDLMSFKAKYDHCDVSKYGENASLGIWCCKLRGSYQKIQNDQKPTNKLSDEQIQRLTDAGFNWSLQKAKSG
jgi:hypothetical protein